MRSPHTHFCQTNSLVRDSLIRLAEGHSLTVDGTRRTPFLPNKLAPPASPSTPFLPPVRRRRKQTSTVRAEHAPVPRCAFWRYLSPSTTSTERFSRSLLCSPFGQIWPPRKDSTNERLAFHKAKPRGATLVSVTGAY